LGNPGLGGLETAPAPLANIITLGVRDFVAEREFYLRLRMRLVLDLEDFAVFELRGALCKKGSAVR